MNSDFGMKRKLEKKSSVNYFYKSNDSTGFNS